MSTSIADHVCYPVDFGRMPGAEPPAEERCGTRNLCNLKFEVESPMPQIHGSLNWFACLDLEQCPSTTDLVQSVFSRFCQVPSCTVFPEDSADRELCMVTQVLGCDKRDRFTLNANFTQGFSMLCSQDQDVGGDSANAPDVSLMKELQENSQIISFAEMNAILKCGVSYWSDIPSLMYSGLTSSLGSYNSCISHHKATSIDPEYNYCTVNYDNSAHQGVCIPETCTGPDLFNLLSFVCNRTNSNSSNGYRGTETCLDYLDIIPFNLCLMTEMLGCNSGFFGGDGSVNFLKLFQSNVTRRQLHEWADAMPAIGPKSFSVLVDDMMQSVNQRLNDFETDFNHPPGRSLAAKWPDTIKDYRYESPMEHKFRIRCGGWTAPLDGSKFNQTAGIITCILIALLPFLPFTRRHLRGFFTLIPDLIKTWFSNISSNLNLQVSRGLKLGTGDFAHVCGLRSLNMFWVVLGHTFTFAWQEGVDRNFSDAVNLVHQYKFQVIMSGQLAVDSFFFLAGLMFGLFTSARIEKRCIQDRAKGHRTNLLNTIPYVFYESVKRYLRLMPTTAVILAFSYWVLPYLGSGPMWVSYVDYLRYGLHPLRTSGCYKIWWSVLTLTNNFGEEGLSCMGHTWYLSNDYQFYILSTLIFMVCTIFSVQRRGSSKQQINRRPFYTTLGVVFVVCSAVSYYIVRRDHLHFTIPAMSDSTVTGQANQAMMDVMKNWMHFYVRPWCRIGPYIIGVVAGISYRDKAFERMITVPSPVAIDKTSPLLQQKSPTREESLPSALRRSQVAPETPRPQCSYESMDDAERQHPDTYIITLYTVAATVIAWVCIFSLPYAANKGNKLVWNETLDQLWYVFNRSIFALTLAWFSLILVYVPKFNKQLTLLKPLRALLSSRLMALCSIFTFTFYLTHPFIEQTYYAARSADIIITNAVGWFTTVAHFALTVVIGVLVSVMIEVPLGSQFVEWGL